MKDPLFQKCFTALKRVVPEKSKLLLAFSGGVDSTALFHLLRESKALYPFTFECVHVDHQWREESAREAAELEERVESYGIPFHLREIPKLEEEGNKEERYREARYQEIRDVYEAYQFDFLLTAHQGDDQAETVLKRLFEGASLYSLGGILEERILFGMRVFRPLLSIYRKELETYLTEKKYPFVDDSTNYDTTYTRARTRHELLPYLEESFGKRIKKNLCRLARESRELSSAVEKEVDGLIDPEAAIIPWEALHSLSSPQMSLVVQKMFPHFSADEKECFSTLVKKRSIGKKVREVELVREGVKRGDKF